MRSYFAAVRSFLHDDDGAALIEYTMLIGILVLAVIASIIAVGGLGEQAVDDVERPSLLKPLSPASAAHEPCRTRCVRPSRSRQPQGRTGFENDCFQGRRGGAP